MKKQPVAAYGADLKLVRIFESQTAAANAYGVLSMQICKAVRLPTHTAAGLYWRRADGFVPPTIERPITERMLRNQLRRQAVRELAARRRAVVEVNQQGAIVREFNNGAAAARFYGVSRTLIGMALADPPAIKTVLGRRIRYAHPELRQTVGNG